MVERPAGELTEPLGPDEAGPEAAGPEAAGPEAAGPEAAGPALTGPPAARSARRRRLHEVFGDVLPETTADEREPSGPGSQDQHLLREVPPHHG